MIISILPQGNFGNRIIEFLPAIAVAEHLEESVEFNVDIPEFGYNFDRKLHEDLKGDIDRSLIIIDKDMTSIFEIVDKIHTKNISNLIFEGFFQRVEIFADRLCYLKFFPAKMIDKNFFGDNELVINIRAGELRSGVDWYPLVPPKFYKQLIQHTGLKPVLLGQLDSCQYLDEILENLPDARLIPSDGAFNDFNRLRHAQNICISVSTFSWLAAWLSDAAQIHYPILGFLHPATFRPGRHGLGGINLIPLDDDRYIFHLFPMIRGSEEEIYLERLKNINPISKIISKSHAQLLAKNQYKIKNNFNNEKIVDEIWYLEQYIEACWEISEGWYYDVDHHYSDVGVLRGYKPYKPRYIPKQLNISINKPSTQSSISVWSLGNSLSSDAARAVDGDIFKENGFHTDKEDNPWWMVDLEDEYNIEIIQIYNRRSNSFIRKRINPFVVEVSLDGNMWDIIEKTENDFDFGTDMAHGENMPFECIFDARPVLARYVRIRVLKKNEILHLAAVEIFGRK